MLPLAYLREHTVKIKEGLGKRNFPQLELVDQLLETDRKRRSLQSQLDETLSKTNQMAKEIGGLFKSGQSEKANELKTLTADLKAQSKELQEKIQQVELELFSIRTQIPNIPDESVPPGFTEDDNEEVFSAGSIPELGDDALPHWELASKYDLVDFELGSKITGAGFPVYKDKGAKLQRALIQYFLDKNTAAGYREFQVPYLVNEGSGFGTGQLPDKDGQMYHVREDNLYLIPTAEVPLTNLFRNKLLNAKDLPICLTSYTPCFRREAGSWGKDVRGLNRLHQFDKVELVKWTHPEQSFAELESLRSDAESLLQKLELPYRVLSICSGDIGFPHAKQYDLEVWAAGQKRWLEVSSCSNFTDFQARRANIRFRDDDGKPSPVHTLNGSALAIPRVLAAILENKLRADGLTEVPKCLRKWLPNETIGF